MKNKILFSSILFGLATSSSMGYAFDKIHTVRHHNGDLIQLTATAQDPKAQKAFDFIKSIADRGLGLLADKKMEEEKRKAEFRKLLHDSFDMKTIGRFALGRFWKTSSDAQRSEYLSLFENMIVDVYSRRFSDYNGQKLNVLKATPDGEKDAVVNSVIVPNEGPEVKVDWRVREKDGQYRVVDIIVEGVSMSLTQRSDFASVIQRGGGSIDVLIKHLKKDK